VNKSIDIAPYRIPGRLADVIAAIQVMAARKRPEAKIEDWAYEFDRDRNAATVNRWTGVFRDHREFFLTYRLPGEHDLKAALRWRYALKTLIRRVEKNIHLQKSKLFPRSSANC